MVSEIYILDGGTYTGGGEALFQLGCDLIQRGYKVSLIDALNSNDPSARLPEKFKQYMGQGLRYCLREDIVDTPTNAIIVPEAATEYLFKYKKLKKIIYWLSYENYDGKISWNQAETLIDRIIHGSRRNVIKLLHYIRNIIKYHTYRYPIDRTVNLSGSHYTNKMLKKCGADFYPLFHSIGIDFLEAGMYDNLDGREDIVLYNPAKPSRLTKELIKRNKYNYVPIASLNVDQMISLFRKSKIYIDFGNFPGPERLPKETVFNGVNILVWALHAASTDDVLIPAQYKLDIKTHAAYVEKVLANMLDNYREQNVNFDAFREMVSSLQEGYNKQLDIICKEL